jgi:hypothetical protein
MGYIQCLANTDITQIDIINIIGLHNIDIWEKANIFQHLSFCDTLIHSIVLHDAQLYYEDGHPTNTMNSTIIECTNLLPFINNNDILNLFQKSKNEMALVIEQTKNDISCH